MKGTVSAWSKMSGLDAIWAASLLLWFLGSIWAAWAGNGEIFPRLGACLVAIVALYFALLPPLHLAPPSYHESNALIFRQSNLNAQAAYLANQNVSELAASIAKILQDQQTNPPESIERLAGPSLDDSVPKNHEIGWEENDRRVLKSTRAQEAAEKDVARVKAEGLRLQAVLIFIGTLQWGVGDLVGKWASQ